MGAFLGGPRPLDLATRACAPWQKKEKTTLTLAISQCVPLLGRGYLATLDISNLPSVELVQATPEEPVKSQRV